VGKDTIQIAQDLLIQKLGELSGEETNQDEADSDFDLYAQHFERPIDKSKMEAITVLIEEGNKKQKKSSANKRMTAQVGLDA
jgi:ABC-type Fe2+-enterobactin transport system substrate-binding protein